MTEKILGSHGGFNVIERDGKFGIHVLYDNVVIMPFVRDSKWLPPMIGLIKEPNPFREGGNTLSLITGTKDSTDPDYLTTAIRELKEESGYDVTDTSRWYYMGNVYSSKIVDHEQPCFAVDVTDMVKGEATGDGSESEKLQEFILIPANDVVKVKDIFIPGLFLKLFKYVMGIEIQNDGEEKDK
jgi:8-oxo-dGTP pyrophosphatase MutT (NUDIX family)